MVRTPDGEREAGVGDAIAFPTGESGAHQVINLSSEPARVMMISTMIEPEIAEYPDSGNIDVFAGTGTRSTGDGAGPEVPGRGSRGRLLRGCLMVQLEKGLDLPAR